MLTSWPAYRCVVIFDHVLVHSHCKSDANFADKIRHIRDPKQRMQTVWSYCKGKMICEPDEPKEENDGIDNDEPKKGHGGCGAAQPQIRKEGLKLFAQYKRSRDEDEVSRWKFIIGHL